MKQRNNIYQCRQVLYLLSLILHLLFQLRHLLLLCLSAKETTERLFTSESRLQSVCQISLLFRALDFLDLKILFCGECLCKCFAFGYLVDDHVLQEFEAVFGKVLLLGRVKWGMSWGLRCDRGCLAFGCRWDRWKQILHLHYWRTQSDTTFHNLEESV